MDAVAEREFRAAQAFEQVFGKRGDAEERGLQDFVPLFGGIVRSDRRCGSAGHFGLSPADPAEELVEVLGAED